MFTESWLHDQVMQRAYEAKHRMEIYPVDSVIHFLNNWGQVSVVQKLDNTIRQINLYPGNWFPKYIHCICSMVIYSLNSAIQHLNDQGML